MSCGFDEILTPIFENIPKISEIFEKCEGTLGFWNIGENLQFWSSLMWLLHSNPEMGKR